MTFKTMENKSECFVSGTLAIILHISRFVGLAPLNFVKKKAGWCVSLSPALCIYGYILVTVMNLTTLVTLIKDSVEPEKSTRMTTNTRRIVWITDVMFLMAASFVAVYGSRGQMKSMIACLNYLQKMNYELNIYHWPRCYEKIKMALLVVWMIFTVAITTVDNVLLTLNFTTEYAENTHAFWMNIMYTFYYGCYWIIQIQELQFIMITMHVLYTFKSINECMRNLLHALTDSDIKNLPLLVPFNKKSCNTIKKLNRLSAVKVIDSLSTPENKWIPDPFTKPHHENVRTLAIVYASVCDVVREVDKKFGLSLLLLLGSCLFHLVITPYYLISSLFENENQDNINHFYVIVQAFWCIFHSVNLILAIEPCHMTHMEMEITRELVSHLMRCTHSTYEPLSAELELFFRHLVLNEASYSPLRVTTLRRSLIATIFGSITTYLVVIVQL